MAQSDFAAAQIHRYRIDGQSVPGVTSIIDVIDKPQFKWSSAEIAAQTAITNWRKKKKITETHRAWLASSRGNTPSSLKKRTLAEVGTDNDVYGHWCRGEFDRQWRAKGDRGNRIHTIAHKWSNGEDAEIQDGEEGFVRALELFHADYRPRFEAMECIVLNNTLFDTDGEPLHYGGRFDAVATFRVLEMHKGSPRLRPTGTYLIDYKTGGKWVIPVAMQLVAYAMAELAVFNENGSLNSLVPMPQIDGVRVVYLNEDGTFSVEDPFETIDEATAWQGFIACRKLYGVNKKMNDLAKGKTNDDIE